VLIRPAVIDGQYTRGPGSAPPRRRMWPAWLRLRLATLSLPRREVDPVEW